MSLKSFHVFFIVTALALLAFLGWWSGSRVLEGHNGQNKGLAACAVLGLAVGVAYLGWFLRKYRHLSEPET
jgi:hypothetical protein